ILMESGGECGPAVSVPKPMYFLPYSPSPIHPDGEKRVSRLTCGLAFWAALEAMRAVTRDTTVTARMVMDLRRENLIDRPPFGFSALQARFRRACLFSLCRPNIDLQSFLRPRGVSSS